MPTSAAMLIWQKPISADAEPAIVGYGASRRAQPDAAGEQAVAAEAPDEAPGKHRAEQDRPTPEAVDSGPSATSVVSKTASPSDGRGAVTRHCPGGRTHPCLQT